MESTLYILLFGTCLAASFLLSGMEAGMLALSRFRIRHWMREGNPKAKVLLDYLENPEGFLWTILVGNTLSNIALVSLGVLALYAWFIQWPAVFLLLLAVSAILFYAFCELLPKMLFRMFPNRLCLVMATPFRAFHLLLKPLVTVMTWLTQSLGGRQFTGTFFGDRHELRQIILEPDQSLTQEERLMISRVLDMPHWHVRHIAVPMDHAVSVNTDDTVAHFLALCRKNKVSRALAWQRNGNQKRLAGFVSLKSVLFQDKLDPRQAVDRFVKPALYLDSHLNLEDALRQMQRHRQRLAVVCGPRRKETGIISLQDILKTIFGEVRL